MRIVEWFIDLSELWLDCMLRALTCSLWAILIAILADRCLRSASLRSWLWRFFFVKVMLAFVLPIAIVLPLLPSSKHVSDPSPSVTSVSSNLSTHSPVVQLSVEETSSNQFSMTYVLFGLWCLVVLSAIVAHLIQWVRTRRMIQQASIQPDIALAMSVLSIARLLKRTMRVSKVPKILYSESVVSPMLVGCWAPTIVLPRSFCDEFGTENAKMALAHELAHLARRDLMWNGLVSIVHIMFFFHPLVWYACYRYRATQESACDAMAIQRAQISRFDFAKLLVRVANSRPVVQTSFASVAFVRHREFLCLVERLNAMKYRNVGAQGVVATAMTVIASVLLLAPVSLGQSIDDESKKAKKESKKDRLSRNSKESKSGSTSASGGASAQGFGSSSGGMASGSSSGSGGGFSGGGSSSSSGFSSGGSGGTFSSASADVVVGSPRSSTTNSPGSSPGSLNGGFQTQNQSSNSNGVSVTRSVEETEDGKVTRVTAMERDREITILEDAEGIELTIRGKRRGSWRTAKTIEAESADDLKKKDAEGYKLYQRYVLQDVANGTERMFAPGQDVGGTNPAQALMRKQLEEMLNRDELDPTSRQMIRDMLNRLPGN